MSRIIDADTAMLRDALHEAIEGQKQAEEHARDALANIDRLTALVDRLKWERDMAVEGQRVAIESERKAKEEKEKAESFNSWIGRERDREHEKARRLKEYLTAAEQERDAARMQVEIERGERRKSSAESEWRIRELEAVLRCLRSHMEALDARGAVAEIDAALVPAPPAETPAPTCGECGRSVPTIEVYAGGNLNHVCGDCAGSTLGERDHLRAELAAERKRVEEALGQIDTDRIRHFNECKEREGEIARLRQELEDACASADSERGAHERAAKAEREQVKK